MFKIENTIKVTITPTDLSALITTALATQNVVLENTAFEFAANGSVTVTGTQGIAPIGLPATTEPTQTEKVVHAPKPKPKAQPKPKAAKPKVTPKAKPAPKAKIDQVKEDAGIPPANPFFGVKPVDTTSSDDEPANPFKLAN